MQFFVAAPRGLEPICCDEALALGIPAKPIRGGITFEGSLEMAYRMCLWARCAGRVLLNLLEAPAETEQELYEAALTIAWHEHLSPQQTFLIDVTLQRAGSKHSQFVAQRVKDAVVDQLREKTGLRPSVSKQAPDIRIHTHWDGKKVSFAIDLSGDSLHRRGYRLEQGLAPMKEHLASALLYKMDWPQIAQQSGLFLDPMCGSGTLVLEAALMAIDSAPGLLRNQWGFSHWLGHDARIWGRLQQEAVIRRAEGQMKIKSRLLGSDIDRRMISIACENAQRAGVADLVDFQVRPIHLVKRPAEAANGLIVVNPPYGERLSEQEALFPLYEQLSAVLKREFVGWKAGMITTDAAFGKRMGIRAHKINQFYNGALECKFLQFDLQPERFVDPQALAQRDAERAEQALFEGGGQDFLNRLQKNQRKLANWVKRDHVECYRVYDADLPDFALAIDCYRDYVLVQEYAPPASIAAEKAESRLQKAIALIPQALDVDAANVICKTRRRQRGAQQYERLDTEGNFMPVHEGQCELLVNLTDYLDTGLFLDHRNVRLLLEQKAKGKHFLNLFCYTATASVHAAAGGALTTTSVDLSHTYLDWAERNFRQNGWRVDATHRLIQADVLAWLKEEEELYDLIFLDPPTFSNSKRMEDTLDIQRDHVALIQDALACLAEGGELIFSTNYRRFQLDTAAFADWQLEDISQKTLPPDFQRNKHIRQCWRIWR